MFYLINMKIFQSPATNTTNPVMILDYNSTKGAVDNADKMILNLLVVIVLKDGHFVS